MLGLGMGEILIVCAVVLVIVGPDKLPHFMRNAGRMYGKLRRTADEMRRALVIEADRQDADERYAEMKRRRAEAEAQRKQAEEANPGVTPQEEHSPGLPPAADAAPLDGMATSEGMAAPHGVDDEFERLLADPNGPYATGQSLEPPDDVDMAAVSENVPPAGIAREEWERLPEHIKRMLRAAG